MILQGDCLDIMRNMSDASIDLIYLDPPFCTEKDWGAFDDRWVSSEDPVTPLSELAKATHGEAMSYYLRFMTIRVLEMHRLLKETGSIYLHCDPTASHYLKLMLDAIFGKENYRNDITWHCNKWTNAAKHFQRNHDSVLFYVKSDKAIFNKQFIMTDDKRKVLERGWKKNDANGVRQLLVYDRQKAQGQITNAETSKAKVVYLDDKPPGVAAPDVWSDIKLSSNSKERTGYPTQKPIALLERIIKSSSREGDIVLDPFCGSGTTLVAAKKLGRDYIGIDISEEAIEITKRRHTYEPASFF